MNDTAEDKRTQYVVVFDLRSQERKGGEEVPGGGGGGGQLKLEEIYLLFNLPPIGPFMGIKRSRRRRRRGYNRRKTFHPSHRKLTSAGSFSLQADELRNCSATAVYSSFSNDGGGGGGRMKIVAGMSAAPAVAANVVVVDADGVAVVVVVVVVARSRSSGSGSSQQCEILHPLMLMLMRQ